MTLLVYILSLEQVQSHILKMLIKYNIAQASDVQQILVYIQAYWSKTILEPFVKQTSLYKENVALHIYQNLKGLKRSRSEFEDLPMIICEPRQHKGINPNATNSKQASVKAAREDV